MPQKKVDIHRETLLELLETERNYNTALDILVEVRTFLCMDPFNLLVVVPPIKLWMTKLKESKLVEPADLSAIFSNIEQIRNLNKVLRAWPSDVVLLTRSPFPGAPELTPGPRCHAKGIAQCWRAVSKLCALPRLCLFV